MDEKLPDNRKCDILSMWETIEPKAAFTPLFYSEGV